MSTRAAAALFAMEHGLATLGELPIGAPATARSFPARSRPSRRRPWRRCDRRHATRARRDRGRGRRPGGPRGRLPPRPAGLPFVILDANERIGDSWRKRWDSLRLFTPARYNGLCRDGLPRPGHSFSTKDEVADYLEAYAARFELPVRTGVRVDRLSRNGSRFVVEAGDRRFEADNVVVAMASHQVPRVPRSRTSSTPASSSSTPASTGTPRSSKKGRCSSWESGNSGAEIALEVAKEHPTWLAGRRPAMSPSASSARRHGSSSCR